MNKKEIVILYHGDCADGFSSAWAAWKKFGGHADYIALRDREKPPAGLAGKELYCIDWTYPRGVARKLLAANRKLVSIDHHISAAKDTRISTERVFDTKHSGAVLTWQYFHPTKPVPVFLKYIEDYDIWRLALTGSRAANMVIDVHKKEFKAWPKLAARFDKPARLKKVIAEGRAMLKAREERAREIVRGAEKVNFLGYEVLAVQAPHFLRNEVGHLLAVKHPPFGVMWHEENGRIKLSLRAVGKFDLRVILKHFKSAGGHKQAAGITIPKGARLPWKPAGKATSDK